MATTRTNTRICLRRATYDNYMLNNPTLYDGEISLVYLPGSQRICLAIGDGETPFRDLTLYTLEPLKEKIVPTTYCIDQAAQAIQNFSTYGLTMAETIENLKQAWQTLGSNAQTAIAKDLVGERNASEFINIIEEEKEEEPKSELSNSIEEFRNYINNLN